MTEVRFDPRIHKINFAIEPVDILGFDILAKIHPSDQDGVIIFIRHGPFSGGVITENAPQDFLRTKFFSLFSGSNFLNSINNYFNQRVKLDPLWINHREVWFSRAISRMLYICKVIEIEDNSSPYLSVARYLKETKKEGAPETEEDIKALAEALHLHTCALIETTLKGAIPCKGPAQSTELHPPTTEIEIQLATRDIDGVLWLDACLADYIANLPGGTRYATTIRENSRERLATYRNNPSPENLEALFSALWLRRYTPEPHEPFLMRPAEVLWYGTVKPELERKAEREARKRRNPPALAISIAPAIARYCGWRSGSIVTISDDGGLNIIDSHDTNRELLALAPALEVQNMQKLCGRSLVDDYPALATPIGHTCITWIVRKCWQRHMDGEPSPERIDIEGGLSGFLEILKIKGNGGTSQALASILRAGKSFHMYSPGVEEVGGLWTYHHREARRGQPSLLKISVSPFLTPNYTTGERLVPIVATPSLVGRNNEHAAQMAFKCELVLEMVRAGETVLDEGVLLPEPELERLASLVGLPTSTMNKALDRWTQDTKDGPRMLDRSGDRFLLADNDPYRDARNFVLEGARRVREGRERGLQSAAARERARRRRRPCC